MPVVLDAWSAERGLAVGRSDAVVLLVPRGNPGDVRFHQLVAHELEPTPPHSPTLPVAFGFYNRSLQQDQVEEAAEHATRCSPDGVVFNLEEPDRERTVGERPDLLTKAVRISKFT